MTTTFKIVMWIAISIISLCNYFQSVKDVKDENDKEIIMFNFINYYFTYTMLIVCLVGDCNLGN